MGLRARDRLGKGRTYYQLDQHTVGFLFLTITTIQNIIGPYPYNSVLNTILTYCRGIV